MRAGGATSVDRSHQLIIRSMLAISAFVVSVFLTSGPALGQSQSAPPRDRPADPTATGSIKGRVVDGRTGAPIRRALVRLIGFANLSSSGSVPQPMSVSTDAD